MPQNPKYFAYFADNNAITPDPVYAKYGVYIRNLYPTLALQHHGKFKHLFIIEHHPGYMFKFSPQSLQYPIGKNHEFTVMGFKVDKLYYPYNPKTEKQQTWRSYFTKGKNSWDGLGPFWRSEYIRQAKTIVRVNRRRQTGINRYLSLYLRQARELYY